MNAYHIRIVTEPPPEMLGFEGRSLASSMYDYLSKTTGGGCVGEVMGSAILLEIRARTSEEFEPLLDSFCDRLRKQGRSVDMTIVDTPRDVLSPAEFQNGLSLNPSPVKLTKAYLISLPEGAFLTSCIMKRLFEPAFAEIVGPIAARQALWEKLQAAGTAQRNCLCFPSRTHFEKWKTVAAAYFDDGANGGKILPRQ